MAASCALHHPLSCSLATLAKHESTLPSTSQQSSCISFCCGQSFLKERHLKRSSVTRNIGSAAIHQGALKQPALSFQWGSAPKSVKNSRRISVRANADSETDSGSGKAPFGYTRKDVLVLGLGVIVAGFALKYGLEAVGVDPLVAGNVIQISFVLGLMILWVFSYVFRVANKEMTYVKQLKSYEEEVMKKRLEELPEAELENMLAAVEEEKRRLEERRKTGQQQ
ncbi:hypothetical protein KFL_000920030 [Klebsormidium nitens]|uniref:Uncharacterized protein n=1 Tax=Klebsormidium nitens TaxID=105231 RepID=A0A0U9HLN4_KLENI|nr:hypothetical protein KFL_000920030 [Klebsormidium nitens]|eukprot:GAQ81818.1 hypothetical protein KFL_000920030 [Klebsormidium nitens]